MAENLHHALGHNSVGPAFGRAVFVGGGPLTPPGLTFQGAAHRLASTALRAALEREPRRAESGAEEQGRALRTAPRSQPTRTPYPCCSGWLPTLVGGRYVPDPRPPGDAPGREHASTGAR